MCHQVDRRSKVAMASTNYAVPFVEPQIQSVAASGLPKIRSLPAQNRRHGLRVGTEIDTRVASCHRLSHPTPIVPAMSQQRPWRAVDPDLFRFTTTELRDLHIGLMSAFDQAAIVAPALNLDQVRGALRTVGWEEWVDDASLQRALTALVGWGLLDATQDHGAVYSTPEEFERKNLQWSLTPRGEAGISGL